MELFREENFKRNEQHGHAHKEQESKDLAIVVSLRAALGAQVRYMVGVRLG